MNLTIENLTKSYGEKKALDIDRYSIHSGEIIGLVGNNGAGKTTLFRIILDLLHADSGCVTIDGFVDGRAVSCDTSKSEDWKAYTGAFVDAGFLIDYLTPEEYFRFIAKISGISDEVLNDRLLQFDSFMNGEVLGQKTLIRNLSMGNKQKVGIIGAMLHHPKLLILDEPFNFLDPTSQLAMKYLLETYNKEMGATIIVSSHNLTHTIDICTRITLLEHGSIIKDYDKDYALLTSEIEAYFKGNINI
ncbi:MAG: ABC transporter ATP-binding protein [Bacteroidaceae bacterium]|nr:ABC transporter ATP-binding protein [Bacteroidaceae bacterium]